MGPAAGRGDDRPEAIDSALLRDGRCDFKIVVKRPNQDAIRAILTKGFAGTLANDPREDLVVAAVESLFDPHKVLIEAHALKIELGDRPDASLHHRHFLLEHIVSGAMAASIPARATRRAFARDKAVGLASGVTVADVVAAVNDLFAENKTLDHAYALREFQERFLSEVAGGLKMARVERSRS